MSQDCLLEAAQLGRGLDSKLAHESLPAVAIARERVDLSTAAVEGRHQLPEQVLVERFGRDGALQVGNELVVVAEGEGHVKALRPGGATRVVEPRRCRAGLRLELDVGQRVAAPKTERLVECLQRLIELVCGDRGARGAEKLGEACGVQFAGVAFDRVPRCTGGDDRRVAERGPKA